MNAKDDKDIGVAGMGGGSARDRQGAIAALGDMTYAELRAWVYGHRQRPSRVGQIWRGINLHGAPSIQEIEGLSGRVKARLGSLATCRQLDSAGVDRASDGTRKLLFRSRDGDPVESVLFPMTKDYSLCLSSQAGCRVGCRFCLTGSLSLPARSLTAGEIVDQYRAAACELGDPYAITNLVFMGMGEPLLNYRNLRRAIEILCDDHGRHFSTRRITVSTAGVAPLIPRLGRETSVNLAVSLNAGNDALRDELMPINRRWPLAVLKKALLDFPLPNRRRITIEYVLLDGVNDSPAQAEEVVRFLAGLDVKVNVIPFNSYPGARFKSPDEARVRAFGKVLWDADLPVQLRELRGDEVRAACGQLGGDLDPRAFLG